jgi:hypothetical protein
MNSNSSGPISLKETGPATEIGSPHRCSRLRTHSKGAAHVACEAHEALGFSAGGGGGFSGGWLAGRFELTLTTHHTILASQLYSIDPLALLTSSAMMAHRRRI